MDLIRIASTAKVEHVPHIAGQTSHEEYSLVRKGIPMPPGGAGYLVQDHGDRQVSIQAYIDSYGRVFEASEPLAMPPAHTPRIQVETFEKDQNRGVVEVHIDKFGFLRIAQFDIHGNMFTVTQSRVTLGDAAQNVRLDMLCCISYLAFCTFPERAGVSLVSSSVRSTLEKLQSSDIFEVISGILEEAKTSETYPYVRMPGVVAYLLRMLRDAGLEDFTASQLMAKKSQTALPDTQGFINIFQNTLAQIFGDIPIDVEVMHTDSVPAELLQPPADAQVTVLKPDPDSDSDEQPESDLQDTNDEIKEDDATRDEEDDHPGDPLDGFAQTLQSVLGSLAAEGVEIAQAQGLVILSAPEVPEVHLLRTTEYANTFFVGFDRSKVNPDAARKLLEAEGIFNRFLFMVEKLDKLGLVQTATEEQCAELDLWQLDDTMTLLEPYIDVTKTPEHAMPAPDDSGDLPIRIAFARGCECLRLPFRLEYRIGFDNESSMLVIDAVSPASYVMPRERWLSPEQEGGGMQGAWYALTNKERAGAAARYTLHLACLVAGVGFWSSRRINRVIVNCYIETGKPELDCVASFNFGRAWFFANVGTEAARTQFSQNPFGILAEIPHAINLDSSSWELGTVVPLVEADDLKPSKDSQAPSPEVDAHELPFKGSVLLHANTISDLGIYEEGKRKDTAKTIVNALTNGGIKAGLAAARDEYERTENPLIKSACLRACDVISSVDVSDEAKDAVTSTFVDIYGFKAAMEHASNLVKSSPFEALKELEDIIRTCEENCLFADTTTRCYRYFDAYAARAVYALRCDGHDAAGREVCLCGDEYYLAHYRIATLLGDTLETNEEAINHARRCVQLAPAVAGSYLRLARCYFVAFDYASEIDTLLQMLTIAWNPADIGMALYWLGYSYLMTGKREVGIACYELAPHYEPNLSQACIAEVADHYRKTKTIPVTLAKQEAIEILEAEGIDLDLARQNAEFIVMAAGVAVEAGSYQLGSTLLGSASLYLKDDALPPVLDSLQY